MFIPHLALRYAGMLVCALPPVFGQPAAGTLLMGVLGFSVPARVDVPLARNKRRGSCDLRSRGTKVAVMTCVPVTLTFQEEFQAWRIVMLPAWSCESNAAPASEFRIRGGVVGGITRRSYRRC